MLKLTILIFFIAFSLSGCATAVYKNLNKNCTVLGSNQAGEVVSECEPY